MWVRLLLVGVVGCRPVAGPTFDAVAPESLPAVVGGEVTLSGAQLVPVVHLDFDRPSRSTADQAFGVALVQGDVVTALVSVTWVNERSLLAEVPAGLDAGVYDVRLTTPAGVVLSRAAALTLTPATQLSRDGGPDDAGVDAGPPDAGVDAGVDAGPPDAGVDAGPEDAGTPDSGLDAGPGDAGPADAGCTTTTFLDVDLDGHGDPASGAVDCSPSRVLLGDDCDDVDPATHPGATEVCNGLDDNCNGAVDEGGCPADAGWSRRTDTGSNDQDWASLHSFARGAVWLVGTDNVWVRRGSGAFVNVSDSCPSNLAAVWSQHDGGAVVAGGNPGIGRVATHLYPSQQCDSSSMTSDPFGGLVGFDLADGGVVLQGVMVSGRRLEHVGTSPLTQLASNVSTVTFTDLHGVTPERLFAVGGAANTTHAQRAYGLGDDGGWQEEALDGGPGTLYGVWALEDGSVFAAGTGALYEKHDGGWLRWPSPDGGVLRSVRAFNRARVYAVGDDGRVYRWNARTWQVLFDDDGGRPLRDLGGVAEDDLWAAGLNGVVVHWP
jgi:hypothetical protein